MGSLHMEDLIRKGELERRFVKMSESRSTTECWISRASLDQWIKTRDAELAQYISCPETRRALGLPARTILPAAQAGLIRYVRGLAPRYPRGAYFLREDVMKIKYAFEKHALPVREYFKRGGLVTLSHTRTYLVPAVIRAVVEGALIPVAHNDRFPGITGYVFPAEQIGRYRSAVGVQTPPEGFLNYSEAAARLGSSETHLVAGLVAQGRFGAFAEFQSRHSKLVPTAEFKRFVSQYISVGALARHLHVSGVWLSRHLKSSRTPMLAVPLGAGSRALFLRREIAAALRISQSTSSRR